MGEPINAFAPNSPGTEDYRSLAKEILAQEEIAHDKAAN
jgi:cellulose biosynthesis protein BcsQ